jgi:hypothetical protein
MKHTEQHIVEVAREVMASISWGYDTHCSQENKFHVQLKELARKLEEHKYFYSTRENEVCGAYLPFIILYRKSVRLPTRFGLKLLMANNIWWDKRKMTEFSNEKGFQFCGETLPENRL